MLIEYGSPTGNNGGRNGVPCHRGRPIRYELINNIINSNNVHSSLSILMDHNMVLSYNYSSQNMRRRRTNAPPLRAILMAMAVRGCVTECIAQCSMTRASLEATGRHHRATTRSVSPRRPPGRQSTQRLCKMYPLCWLF